MSQSEILAIELFWRFCNASLLLIAKMQIFNFLAEGTYLPLRSAPTIKIVGGKLTYDGLAKSIAFIWHSKFAQSFQ